MLCSFRMEDWPRSKASTLAPESLDNWIYGQLNIYAYVHKWSETMENFLSIPFLHLEISRFSEQKLNFLLPLCLFSLIHLLLFVHTLSLNARALSQYQWFKSFAGRNQIGINIVLCLVHHPSENCIIYTHKAEKKSHVMFLFILNIHKYSDKRGAFQSSRNYFASPFFSPASIFFSPVSIFSVSGSWR